MMEIGGYFELELNRGIVYHESALALNSARNCLKYIVKAQRPNKVFVPAYCCDSLIEPLLDEGVEYEFYHIDNKFEIIHPPNVGMNEKIIVINYFALKRGYIHKLYEKYGDRLIVDNTQAFFEKPIPGVDTFYSPRKFFGVSDGGYLYTDVHLNEELLRDESSSRFTHLLGRHERDPGSCYSEYQAAEASLMNKPIKLMSKLTEAILQSLDYKKTSLIRQRNFWALHSQMRDVNNLTIELGEFVPMNYPFQASNTELRAKLHANGVYTAHYWIDAEKRLSDGERNFVECVVFLPVDQRIEIGSLSIMAKLVREFL